MKLVPHTPETFNHPYSITSAIKSNGDVITQQMLNNQWGIKNWLWLKVILEWAAAAGRRFKMAKKKLCNQSSQLFKIVVFFDVHIIVAHLGLV